MFKKFKFNFFFQIPRLQYVYFSPGFEDVLSEESTSLVFEDDNVSAFLLQILKFLIFYINSCSCECRVQTAANMLANSFR